MRTNSRDPDMNPKLVGEAHAWTVFKEKKKIWSRCMNARNFLDKLAGVDRTSK
jgi:hypothetical protein